MSRLPVPGGDDDVWGNVLNDFLSVAHNPDGSLISQPVINSAVQNVNNHSGPNVTLTAGDLGAALDSSVVHNSGNETVNGVKSFTSSPTAPAPTEGNQVANKSYVDSNSGGSSAPNAGNNTAGLIELSGDLGGTYNDPKVVGIQNVAVSTSNPTANQVLIASNGTSASWQNITESDVTNLTADLSSKANDSAVVHKSDYAAKGDLLVGTGVGTYTDLSVGSDGDVLVADSTQTSGIKWAAGGGGGSSSLSGDSDVDISSPSNGQTLVYDSTSSQWVNQSETINTDGSITGGGDISTSPTLSLVNDNPTPGDSQYYGTDTSGNKGFYAITPNIVPATFSYTGLLAIYTGDFQWYNDTGRTLTINSVRASVGTPSTGQSIIVDVLNNGTTIFSGNQPTITTGNNTALVNLGSVTLADGDYLTVNIDQVGSGTAGADLTLTVNMS